MADQSKTDSMFISNIEDISDQKIWSDIRLLHESDNGWCVVYSGLYRGRRVAIKGLKSEYRSSEFHRSLLQKEFEVTSSLNHQNIVAALWIEDVPNIGDAIILEYIDGITLTDYISDSRTIENKQILDIFFQLCSAVGYMHSRQTIHCDLKPSNIMITSSGFVKVIDFGMSRGNGFEKLDFQGGTRGFTAPENLDSGSKATVAADIYSIGTILELMDRKGRFKGVWKKCLSSDPEKRPVSAKEVSEQLNRLYLRDKQRKNIYAAVGILIGIAIVSVTSFFIWQNYSGFEIADDAGVSIQDKKSAPLTVESYDSVPYQAPIEKSNSFPSVDEPKTSKEFIVDVDNAEETDVDNRPFEDQFSEKFQQVAGKRFKEHLLLIDTMTTARSNELQSVEHWRWLAKQDMRKWLEEKLAPDYVRIEEEMKDVERYIQEYANFSHRRGIEWS
ncbi:MAG: serine/threonine protein kinase, partial [Muribaculaceae bacterium]|nr:serine/threonine protein kinase [Muribaculaceae bacterium]